MSLFKTIGQYYDMLKESGLTAEVRFFNSQKIRAIYYKGHIALSSSLSNEEARAILRDACYIADCPLHMAEGLTQHLYQLNEGSVAVWGPNSIALSSHQTA